MHSLPQTNDTARNRALLLADSRKMTASSNLDLRSYWTARYGADGMARAEEALAQLLYDLADGSCAEGMSFDGTYPAKPARGKRDLYYRDLTIRNRAKQRVAVCGGCVNFLLKDLTRRGILERLRLGPEGRLYYRLPMRFEVAQCGTFDGDEAAVVYSDLAPADAAENVEIFPLDSVRAFVDNEPMTNTCSTFAPWRTLPHPVDADFDPLSEAWSLGESGWARTEGDAS